MTINRVLVLGALVVSAALAVVILVTSSEVAVLTAIGWLAVAVALYLDSLLVP